MIQHRQQSPMTQTTQEIEIAPDSHLKEVLGKTKTWVNSNHHQAIKNVSPLLQVSAKASDGVIEALESRDNLIVAVQWHPEWMYPIDANSRALFDDFVDRVKESVQFLGNKQVNNI